MNIFTETLFEVWTGLMEDLFTAHKNGSKVLRDDDAGESLAPLTSSYLAPASVHKKNTLDVVRELKGAMTSVRKEGSRIALAKSIIVGLELCTASRPSESTMALMVVQLGASTSLTVRIDFGQNLMGMAEGPKPFNLKYSTLGLSRSPLTLDN